MGWQACDGPNGAHFCGETPQSAFPARATAGRRQKTEGGSFSQRSANSATHYHPQSDESVENRDESAVFFLGGGILGGPRPVRDANPGSPALRVGNPRRGVTRPFRPGPRRTSSVNTAAPRTRSSPENPRGHSPQETSALPIKNEPLRTIPARDFYHRLDAISASLNNNDPRSHNPCRGFLPSPGRVIGVPQQQRARVAQSLQGISTIAWTCYRRPPTRTTPAGTIPAGDFYHSLGLPERSAGYPRLPSPSFGSTL